MGSHSKRSTENTVNAQKLWGSQSVIGIVYSGKTLIALEPALLGSTIVEYRSVRRQAPFEVVAP